MHSRSVLLASASPRRREILTQLGIEHVVRAVDADETQRSGDSPETYLARVTENKLEAAQGTLCPGEELAFEALLVADTVVIVDGQILGKPRDAEDARRMLSLLSGREHEVHTRFGLARLHRPSEAHRETVRTAVLFRPLSSTEVDEYLESGEWSGKAGAYAIQGRAAAFCRGIRGSYSNVVGLPACEVYVALRALRHGGGASP